MWFRDIWPDDIGLLVKMSLSYKPMLDAECFRHRTFTLCNCILTVGQGPQTVAPQAEWLTKSRAQIFREEGVFHR